MDNQQIVAPDFKTISENSVIVSVVQWNGMLIIATPSQLYAVRDGVIDIMRFIDGQSNGQSAATGGAG